MSLPQQKFREMVFQILYSQDFGCSDEEEEVVSFFMPLLKVTKKYVKMATLRVLAMKEHLSKIDELIQSQSQSYAFERISRVERNILRLGLYELLYDEALPHKVAIAEAVRLCRKFGTRESAGFVNAILDGIYAVTNKEGSAAL